MTTPDALAESRSLKIYYTHTGEKAEVLYKQNGRYVDAGLKKINHLLRDWRRNEPTKMDPRLLDLVWEAYRQSGSKAHIHVISAYRSPTTNKMLRERGRGVAKNSQHTLGKAMDFFLPDVKLSKLREIGLRLEIGGVGYYPTSGSPFVHLDVGNVRHWPRMSRQELARVFPDGKTIHVPSDGKPLARYEQALASYNSRKGKAANIQVAKAETPEKKKNVFQLWAAMTKQDQQDDEEAVSADAEAGSKDTMTAKPEENLAEKVIAQAKASKQEQPLDLAQSQEAVAETASEPVKKVEAEESDNPNFVDPEKALAKLAYIPVPKNDPRKVEAAIALARLEKDKEAKDALFANALLPAKRPQSEVSAALAFAQSQEQTKAQTQFASLSPDDIENMRRSAVAVERAPVGRIRTASSARSEINSKSPVSAATLELALAPAEESENEAAAAIRDLVAANGLTAGAADSGRVPARSPLKLMEWASSLLGGSTAKAKPAEKQVAAVVERKLNPAKRGDRLQKPVVLANENSASPQILATNDSIVRVAAIRAPSFTAETVSKQPREVLSQGFATDALPLQTETFAIAPALAFTRLY